jgi:hypothetical protein
MVVAYGSIQTFSPSFNQDLYLTRYVGFDLSTTARSLRAKSMQLDQTEPIGAGIEPTLAVPSPSTRLAANVVLPDDGPATLVAFDVKGRSVARRELEGVGRGRHAIELGRPGELPAGVYLVALIHGEHRLVSRAVVVR